MIEEILGLGFDTIEISHGIRSSQLEGILAAREKYQFSISSVHNFLPMPVEVQTDSPDCYEFTSFVPPTVTAQLSSRESQSTGLRSWEPHLWWFIPVASANSNSPHLSKKWSLTESFSVGPL